MYYKKKHFIKILVLISTTLFIFPSYTWADVDMLDMDLSSLMEIQITSAGRKEQNLADVPAAVYVIDQEDIKNSGFTSVPELLRLVPGLQVARISSSKWAISSRGFNGTFANKLLVQIDGRSVYTPSYSGVYWDVQNVVLEDVDRIEVIRGPGATLWGANAVNGIINIITKQSSDTQDSLLSAGAGSHEKAMATLRHGAQFNENTYGRFYLSHHEQDSFEFAEDGSDAHDEWQITNGGFRLDGDVGLQNSWTLQGDLYHGDNDQRIDTFWTRTPPYLLQVFDRLDTNGCNLLSRWQHTFSEKSSWTLQTYYDFTNRDEKYLEQTNHTFDIDFQHRFQVQSRHDIVWGIGYRFNKDDFNNTYQVEFTPDSRSNDLFSAFLQDEITLLKEKLLLTIGSKFEYNSYTGFEVQPNMRLLWKPGARHSLWTSVARAVRTPSRIEDSGRITTAVIPAPVLFDLSIFGTSDFESERLTAYEAGYRYIPAQNFSIDIALYCNKYRGLQSYYQESQFMPIYFFNAMEGDIHGLEIATAWAPTDWLETELGYSYIEVAMDDNSAANLYQEEVSEGSSPRHRFSVRTNFDLGNNLYLNLWGHYTDQLKAASVLAVQNNVVVDDYVNLDANVRWLPKEGLEITLAGQNLLDSGHIEFIQEAFTTPIDIQRSIYAKMTWRF